MSGHKGWTPIPDGTRVRHYGQQYPEATYGTGVVVRHFWNGWWLEYIVQLDAERIGKGWGNADGVCEWSADHVVVVPVATKVSDELRQEHAEKGFPVCDTCGEPAVWTEGLGPLHASDEYRFGVPPFADFTGHEPSIAKWASGIQ